MDVISVIDGAHLVPLPNGRAVMVGAPPEALKVLLLWEWPTPRAVVLPPDPLYAHGINQASFEFLLFNHLFREGGLERREPFCIVCDPGQRERVEALVSDSLSGPSEEQMQAWGTPARHARQLFRETRCVAGEVASRPFAELVRVIPFAGGEARLPCGTVVGLPRPGACEVRAGERSVTVPRAAARRGTLPFLFAQPEEPARGARFGLQVIGSASGFAGAEWSSCFIVWINGLALIVDGTPYLEEHLERLGIEDDQLLGHLITHNHEDHANIVGQLINRRRVTVITAPPVMASQAARLSAILDRPADEVRRLLRWVPLHPGFDRLGEPLHWYGAEIRAWYSVHTVPTVGVQISVAGKRIRLPGDTLWGSQLDPLLEQGVLTSARREFIQHSYEEADVVVADAGGGPIHPDPREIRQRLGKANGHFLTTHRDPGARELLPNAEPGASVVLHPAREVDPNDLLALAGSPLLWQLPERWLQALAQAGEVETPAPRDSLPEGGARVVLRGRVSVRRGEEEQYTLVRGDVFAPGLLPPGPTPALRAEAEWTRVLAVPEETFEQLLAETGLGRMLRRLYQARPVWQRLAGTALPLETLLALTTLGRTRRYGAGVTLFRQGERAERFYVVLSGRVEVSRQEAGKRAALGTFGPGYSFGEIGLLQTGHRTATIRALEETEVLSLTAKAFRQYLMEVPLARYQIGRWSDLRRRALPSREEGESG